MLERPWYSTFNYVLAATAILLSLFGLTIIRSATLHIPGAGRDFSHQLAYFCIGVAAMIALAFTDYHVWQRMARPLYIFNLLMLGTVAIAGHSAAGAQRWIGFGPIVFQPSEPAKLLTALSVAAILASPKRNYLSLKDMLVPIGAVLIPAALVLKQPDLGTALVLLAMLTAMLFFALPKLGHFALYMAGLTAAGAVTVLSPFVLKGYQRRRLLVFLDPKHDPQGAGWSLIQSKIAVGSGQLTGKHLYHGTQTQLGFVPAHATDFIFTVIGEELGFVGAMVLLSLYALLLAMALLSVISARDRYGLIVAAGIVAMFTFHILVNIGMTVGIMPITGIPLPFISYGGSSLITFLMAVGVLLNIYMQRHKLTFHQA